VLLDGRDLRTLSLPWYRARVGLVSQEPTLFGTTIARNIAGLTDASDAAIVAAAQAANAHSFIMQLPLKCDTPADGEIPKPAKCSITPGTALLTSLHMQV
jgi:ABC-type multidrug transport system fused ATPase/permease subunit